MARRQRLRRRRRTGATTVQAAWRGCAAGSHLRLRRCRAGATAVQAAWRGRAARSALRDLHHVCDQLRRELGDPPDTSLGGGPTVDYCAGLVRPGLMGVYSRMDDEYFDIRGRQRDHRAELASAALVMQSSLRGRLVSRDLVTTRKLDCMTARVTRPRGMLGTDCSWCRCRTLHCPSLPPPHYLSLSSLSLSLHLSLPLVRVVQLLGPSVEALWWAASAGTGLEAASALRLGTGLLLPNPGPTPTPTLNPTPTPQPSPQPRPQSYPYPYPYP